MQNDDIMQRWLGKLTRLIPATGRGACHEKLRTNRSRFWL